MKHRTIRRTAAAAFFLVVVCAGLAYGDDRAARFALELGERGVSPLLVPGLISLVPIFELRGGIPVGIALLELNPFAVFFTCIFFNLVPVIPILLILGPLKKLAERISFLYRLFHLLEARAEKKKALVQRYKEFGLTLFVGIPLPVTGAWTGSLVAAVMGLPVMKSFLFISLGVCMAGIIVTILSLLGMWGIVGAAVIVLTALVLYLVRMRRGLRSG